MTETRETREEVPCGEVVTVQTLEDGVVVRQDCTVFVKKGLTTESKQGEV